MKKPVFIKSISSVVNKFDTYIIDQWGVMHDGKKSFDHAVNCVHELNKLCKNLILISNSSKKKSFTINKLQGLGFDNKNFLEIVTSGQIIFDEINNPTLEWSKQLGQNFFHLTNINADTNLAKDLSKNVVNSIEDADFILGSTVNSKMSTLDYVPILKKAIKLNLPFVCANPDYESVEKNENFKKTICMGTIGRLYESFGGQLFFLGKPAEFIYKKATESIDKFDKDKTLAIGDSFFHDILGAYNFGIKSVLITTGIHKELFTSNMLSWSDDIDKFFNNLVRPDFICKQFSY